MTDQPQDGAERTSLKFLIETGSESHTTSWAKCQARYASGPNEGRYLYELKASIVSQEWLERTKHRTVVKTVYELPEGTDILIDYSSFEGKEKFIIRLDSAEEVREVEVGRTRLRTYTMKARYHLVRDLIQSGKESLKQSQEEGF